MQWRTAIRAQLGMHLIRAQPGAARHTFRIDAMHGPAGKILHRCLQNFSELVRKDKCSPGKVGRILRQRACCVKKKTTISSRYVAAAWRNSGAKAAASDPKESYTNYILGNDPARWLTRIPNFGRVKYQNIYPGVDVVYYGNRERLEHDFLVSPYSDYHVIRMHLDGSQDLLIQTDGSLKIIFPDGDLTFGKPEAYQSVDGQ